MRLIRFIGDVHGKYRQYRRLIKIPWESIQIGDMGVGFIRYGGGRHGSFSVNPPHDVMVEYKARFIRGNHDNPGVCQRHSQFIKDGSVEGNIMFLGGAKSIDIPWRVAGYSYWPEEELSYQELMSMIDIYEITKPDIMVTHDCPTIAAYRLLGEMGNSPFHDGSRTRPALNSMFELHKPKLWIFGHYHYDFDQVIDGTRFICLNELSFADIDVDLFKVIEKGSGHLPKRPRPRL